MKFSGHTLLLVEDSEDDVILFKRTLKKSGLTVQFVHVDDGQRALDYLAGVGEYQDLVRYPKPSLVLLDLKLPYRDGHEVLQWARSHRDLDAVCFAMLTSSSEPADVEKAYALGANCYLTKSITPETLVELCVQAESFGRLGNCRYRLTLTHSQRPWPPGSQGRDAPTL